MATLIAFFWEKGREADHHHLPCQLQACYKVVEGSKDNDPAKDRSSHSMSSVKRVFLKSL